MDRRSFLTFVGLAAGLSVAGHAEEPDNAHETRVEGWKRALAGGKPLLIAWIPEEASDVSRRGLVWAQLIRCCPDLDVAALALCEVIFARPLPEETEAAQTSAAALYFDANSAPVPIPLPDLSKVQQYGHMSNASSKLASNLREVLVPNQEAIRRLCDMQKEAQLIRNDHFIRLDTSPTNGIRTRISDIDKVAASIWRRMGRSEKGKAFFTPLLAQAALARLFEKDPLGARWNETPWDPCPPCGMAVIPPASRVFLDHFTK